MATDLGTELRRRAEETSEAIAEAARTETERLTAEANRLVEARRSAVLRTNEEEYRSKARADVAAARHEAMRDVLLAKTHVAKRILATAKMRLGEAVQSDAYLATLPAELEEALAFVGEDGTIVRCSKGIASAVQEALRGRPEVRVEPMTDEGHGFVAIDADASVRVDGTLEARLERMTAALSIEIHKLLGGP